MPKCLEDYGTEQWVERNSWTTWKETNKEEPVPDHPKFADLKTYATRTVTFSCEQATPQSGRRLSVDPQVPFLLPTPQRRLLSQARNAYSRFPGDARDSRPLPNVRQIFVRDFDGDGKMDLFLHAPALSPGSCAQRCHSLGRFGYDSFKVHRTGYQTHLPVEDVHEHSYCYCGPAYQLMVAPHPPPSPPKPPPSPFEPPSIPPIQSPGMPPPSPPFPVYRAAGM